MALYKTYLDEDLVGLLQNGNEQAFTELYLRYWDKLYFLAYKHLSSAEASEEIVQEVFLTLWRKKAELTIQSLPAYLASMTRYAVYHNLGRQKNHIYTDTDLAESAIDSVADRATVAMDNKLLLEMVEKLSARLPEKCRLVFIKNKLLDQPLDQVAEELNISQKTAEAHLTKALKIIRSHLGDALSVLLF